jgi:hypothetical protein
MLVLHTKPAPLPLTYQWSVPAALQAARVHHLQAACARPQAATGGLAGGTACTGGGPVRERQGLGLQVATQRPGDLGCQTGCAATAS